MDDDPWDLYRQAVTHPTWAREQGGLDNQRLEFLGDAVLKLLVAEMLFDSLPEEREGGMSQVLHQLVDNALLAEIAAERQLGQLLRLGVGEERQGGRDRASNLADVFEALLGAVYMDQGLDAAREIVRTNLSGQVLGARTRRNPRSVLQIWAERSGLGNPEYRDTAAEGPEHARSFTAEVWVGGSCRGVGAGSRKKKAYAAAAEDALQQLNVDEACVP